MIRNVAHLAAAHEDGAEWYSHVHKTTVPAAVAGGRWVDLSMGAGKPVYNAYVGTQLEATPLVGSQNRSIYVGPSLTTEKRYLQSVFMQTTSTGIPATLMLLDYLLAYPLVDGDSTDLQEMDNTLGLTRYDDGVGVQAMIVCTTPMTAHAAMTVTYTDSEGATGKTASTSVVFSANVGNICSSQNPAAAGTGISPFINLSAGSKGVRKIESVQLATPCGGLFALVLVKPITSLLMREQNVVREAELFPTMTQVPEIKNGAFLNFIANSQSTTSLATLVGGLTFVWR